MKETRFTSVKDPEFTSRWRLEKDFHCSATDLEGRFHWSAWEELKGRMGHVRSSSEKTRDAAERAAKATCIEMLTEHLASSEGAPLGASVDLIGPSVWGEPLAPRERRTPLLRSGSQ